MSTVEAAVVERPFPVRVTTNVTAQQVADLIVTALDGSYGGSNYWADVVKKTEPPAYHFLCDGAFETSMGREAKPCIFCCPLNEGGSITIAADIDGQRDEHNGKTEWDLNLESIARGLQLMADKEPKHFQDAISESSMDAGTADVFLQMCLFGELVYS